MSKIIKKSNSKRWNLWRILDFKYLFFRKILHDFPTFFDKISNL